MVTVFHANALIRPLAISSGAGFDAVAIIESKDGKQRSSGPLGSFLSCDDAYQIAIAWAIAELDAADQ